MKLADMSNEALVQHFAEICLKEERALFGSQISKFNKLFKQQTEVKEELKSRGSDARLELLRLYQHPSMQVRLQAARATLAVAPHEARQMIELIAKSNRMPQAGDAGMTLWNLDRGVFKPV